MRKKILFIFAIMVGLFIYSGVNPESNFMGVKSKAEDCPAPGCSGTSVLTYISHSQHLYECSNCHQVYYEIHDEATVLSCGVEYCGICVILGTIATLILQQVAEHKCVHAERL